MKKNGDVERRVSEIILSNHSKFKSEIENFEPRTLVCHPKDIVTSIRNRDFISYDFERLPRNQDAPNSRILKAKET